MTLGNPEVWVSLNVLRPALQIKEGGRVRSYTFIKAMNQYGSKMPSPPQKKKGLGIYVRKTAEKFFSGQLKKRFIALNN